MLQVNIFVAAFVALLLPPAVSSVYFSTFDMQGRVLNKQTKKKAAESAAVLGEADPLLN